MREEELMNMLGGGLLEQVHKDGCLRVQQHLATCWRKSVRRLKVGMFEAVITDGTQPALRFVSRTPFQCVQFSSSLKMDGFPFRLLSRLDGSDRT